MGPDGETINNGQEAGQLQSHCTHFPPQGRGPAPGADGKVGGVRHRLGPTGEAKGLAALGTFQERGLEVVVTRAWPSSTPGFPLNEDSLAGPFS